MANRDIAHIEIPARNRGDLAKFYSELFGWEINALDDIGYTLWDSGNVGGGFPEANDEYKVGDVMVYVDSDDIDADLKKIEASGGKILHGKTEIPGFGWYAIFTDPTGNRLGLYTSAKKA